MTNYMEEVAKMLGVALDEDFEVDVHGTIVKAKITKKDIYLLGSPSYWGNYNSATLLRNLLRGRYAVCNKPWKPKYRERYYSIGPGGVLESGSWLNDFIDIAMYRLGNCYRTPEEAAFNRDKWIAFYASDEVLEI